MKKHSPPNYLYIYRKAVLNFIARINASKKARAELNFLQNTRWKHISIRTGSGENGVQRFAIFEML